MRHFLTCLSDRCLSAIMVQRKIAWRALIGRNQSRDAIVFLLSGRLSAHSARFWQFSLKI